MKRAERAKALFLEGYNCAQAVVLAFAEDAGLDESVAKAFSRPLGGGMGRLRQTCGAVSGAAVASGVLFPELTNTRRTRSYRRSHAVSPKRTAPSTAGSF